MSAFFRFCQHVARVYAWVGYPIARPIRLLVAAYHDRQADQYETLRQQVAEAGLTEASGSLVAAVAAQRAHAAWLRSLRP